MLNNKFLDNDSYVVPRQSPHIIMDGKSAVCISKNSKYTKHIRCISRNIHFVRNSEDFEIFMWIYIDELKFKMIERVLKTVL